jgi:hypothetical protein
MEELRMTADSLTEAEFRTFAERLYRFAGDLAPRERHFFTAILVRASARPEPDIVPDPCDLEWTVCAELAYSIWQSMRSPCGPISVNPQPYPRPKTGGNTLLPTEEGPGSDGQSDPDISRATAAQTRTPRLETSSHSRAVDGGPNAPSQKGDEVEPRFVPELVAVVPVRIPRIRSHFRYEADGHSSAGKPGGGFITQKSLKERIGHDKENKL